jgi:hypothetical protein
MILKGGGAESRIRTYVCLYARLECILFAQKPPRSCQVKRIIDLVTWANAQGNAEFDFYSVTPDGTAVVLARNTGASTDVVQLLLRWGNGVAISSLWIGDLEFFLGIHSVVGSERRVRG